MANRAKPKTTVPRISAEVSEVPVVDIQVLVGMTMLSVSVQLIYAVMRQHLKLVATAFEFKLTTCKAHIPQKTGLCWVPNTNEIDRNNMKYTCPTQTQLSHTQRKPYFTGSCWGSRRALTACIGFARLCVESARLCFGSASYFNTNMLVSATQTPRVEGPTLSEDPMQVVSRCSGI